MKELMKITLSHATGDIFVPFEGFFFFFERQIKKNLAKLLLVFVASAAPT